MTSEEELVGGRERKWLGGGESKFVGERKWMRSEEELVGAGRGSGWEAERSWWG